MSKPIHVNGGGGGSEGADIIESGITSGSMYGYTHARMLEGRLLTYIESLGLKETQEKAMKDIIRALLDDFFMSSYHVEPELVKKIHERNIRNNRI